MSLEDFQTVVDTSIDTSIFKRAFMKTYHQQRPKLGTVTRVLIFYFAKLTTTIR